MRTSRSLVPSMIAAWLVSGCMLLSGRCLYELRNVIAEGHVNNAQNAIAASAQLILGEQRDHEPNKYFSWQISGAAYKGHVTKIVLRDNAAPNVDVYTFDIAQDARPDLSGGAVNQNEGANLNGLFDLLSSRSAIVVITTDIPGQTTVTIPLTNVTRDDWYRPYCS